MVAFPFRLIINIISVSARHTDCFPLLTAMTITDRLDPEQYGNLFDLRYFFPHHFKRTFLELLGEDFCSFPMLKDLINKDLLSTYLLCTYVVLHTQIDIILSRVVFSVSTKGLMRIRRENEDVVAGLEYGRWYTGPDLFKI